MIKKIILISGLCMSYLNASDVSECIPIFRSASLSAELQREMFEKATWKEDCPVKLERLKILKISYFDFDGVQHNDGEMVVLDAVAERVLRIFRELYGLKFPISKIRRIEYYDGDDNASMTDNNTSAFNYRRIAGKPTISMHSYGVTIDINPVQNPCVELPDSDFEHPDFSTVKISPAKGKDYLNRGNRRPGMIEDVIDIITSNGFTIWGGRWDDPIDWQHVQPSRSMAQLLALMTPEHAYELFEMYVQESKLFNNIKSNDDRFEVLYKANPMNFMKSLSSNHSVLAINPDDAYTQIQGSIMNQ